ncbi:unnamed protein product [Schistosoma margrebowiei]|uniref:Uncharacterized protein n=1 Tax=Schistosoma margrebowiei TaxID=48269 RepID=A0A183N8H6_9TREM|nr:unnamed protein product [Schistosoma margrebowiei]
MERPDNVGEQEDQSNSNVSGEIKIFSNRNQGNPLDPDRTEKAIMGEMLMHYTHKKKNGTHTQGVVLMLSKVAGNAVGR